MKCKAFTVAFGDEKYLKMAKALKRSIEIYSPSIDFEIIDESHLTPISKVYEGADLDQFGSKISKIFKNGSPVFIQ